MSSTPQVRPPLMRPRTMLLGGVCAGIARHLGWNVALTRWIFVALAFCGGAGVLLYLWLWALVPLEAPVDPDPEAETPVHRRVPVPWVLFGVGAVAALLVIMSGAAVSLGWATNAPLVPLLVTVVIGAGGAVAWDQFIDARDPVGGIFSAGGVTAATAETAMRVLSGAVLIAVAVAGPLTWGRATPALGWIGFGLSLVAGVIVLAGPWALGLWRELITERTARVREEQRAEMAAHLHDSVLQTLALIQNRAGASSDVARIARAQERELREWLYAGGGTAHRDLTTDLREFAASLELDFPVRIEIVAAGESAESAHGEVAASAREAMLNAARHAGGDVSVYVENSPEGVDVFIRDRGPGFDLDSVPSDRLGVRESILGRMRRAGGIATVAPGVGGVGIEVHLHYEHTDGAPT